MATKSPAYDEIRAAKAGVGMSGVPFRKVLCALVVLPGVANSQDPTQSRYAGEVRLAGYYTDNFYYDSAAEESAAAAGATLSPRGSYRSSIGRLDLLGTAEAEIATFDTPGGLDDYEDGRVGAQASWQATRRARWDLRTGFQRGHDPFGINRTEDPTVVDREIDLWHSAEVGTLFHYGAPEATLNAEVGFTALSKSYQTNEDVTRFLDYGATAAQYTVFYNFSPKTAALFDFVRTNIVFADRFDADDFRSGDEYRMRTGLRWLATAKTSGDVRVGIYRRNFEGTTFSDQGFDWQANVQWAPRARTLLELETSRASQESYRVDTNVNITQRAGATWKQHWSTRVNSQLNAGRVRTEFLGINRVDTLYNVGFNVDYLLRNGLSMVLGVDTASRESNDAVNEFDRFSCFVGVRLGT
jgi:polysaccharide biosynthesis protein VpsM